MDVKLSPSSADEALRILVVSPISSQSHNILLKGMIKHLINAGHEVVFITHFPSTNLPERLKEIDVSLKPHDFQNEKFQALLEAFQLKNIMGKGNFYNSIDFKFIVYEVHKRFLEHQNVRKLLNDPEEKYDVVILEWFHSAVLTGIPALFKCPFIWMASTEAHGPLLRIIDEIPNPAYSPDLFSYSTPPLTFWERGVELKTMLKRLWDINFHIIPVERTAYNKVFSPIAAARGVCLPSYDEAVFKGSFMFVNSHPSMGTAFRLPQSVKYVAGYHIDDDVEPLPKDLERIFNESKHGVIYFSMGSHLRSSEMDPKMKDSLFEMFGKLKQDVIWKFEDDLATIPKNVHLVGWAPQQSILAHPNLKIFITHGGQLSTTEAIHFGVPVVGVPVVGDQFVNMQAVQSKGFGILVQIKETLADDLSVAIDKMLKDPTYTTTAKFLSSIYHDRPISPGAEIVHWTEHVVKTKGAFHLRSPALLLPWYQKLYLDYAVLLTIAVILLFHCISFICKNVLGLILM